MSEIFYCGRGPGPDSPFVAPFNGEATWRDEPDGTRTCSYCGSLHPDDFLDIMQHYAAGEEGYRFSTTSKGYKAYGNRPGVRNAGDGGIKFYTAHLPDDRTEFDVAWKAAVNRLVDQMGLA